jgi:uncharacterized protein (TIGR00251 family)
LTRPVRDPHRARHDRLYCRRVPPPASQAPAQVRVRLQPRASREEIAGVRNGALLVRVTAPPVDERANQALCKLVAKRAGVAASGVEIVRGGHGRDKLVTVEGIDQAALDAALGLDR